MLKRLACLAVLLLIGAAGTAFARDELSTARLSDGKEFPYVLTTGGGTPRYGVILMPGGSGKLDPRLVDGKLTSFPRRQLPYPVPGTIC